MFPVAVLLELVLRSVLNHQGVLISLILQILAKKHTIFPIRYDVRWMHSYSRCLSVQGVLNQAGEDAEQET